MFGRDARSDAPDEGKGSVHVAKVDAGKNLHIATADPTGVNVAKVDAGQNGRQV